MAPKGKARKKTPFGLFLDEYVKEQSKLGRMISHRIGAEECALKWEKMPPEEKQKYNDLAASFKKNYTQAEKEHKFTSAGVSFAEMERRQQQAKLKVERAEHEIRTTMATLNADTIQNHLFYIVHCNYLCKIEDGIYLPGEIAICEFNLESGLRRTYHTLVNPGPIPVGYGYEAKLMRESVHGLPMPPYEEGISDYSEILTGILKFLEPGRHADGMYPPLYCIEENMKACENIMKTFSDTKCVEGSYFRVYVLHKMLFAMKNRCAELGGDESAGFPILADAITEIEKDTYRYVSGISCAYHAPSESKYYSCSLSIVQRFVYVICDHCCNHLKISLIPGKHIWMNLDVDIAKDKEMNEEKLKFKKRGRDSSSETVSYYEDVEGASFHFGESSSGHKSFNLPAASHVQKPDTKGFTLQGKTSGKPRDGGRGRGKKRH